MSSVDQVRILAPVTEAEVIVSFLRGELESSRWTQRLHELLAADGRSPTLITEPRLHDDAENAYRASLLDRHRGWLRREGLFQGFPERVDWFRAALTRDQVLAILYIDWDWWLTSLSKLVLVEGHVRLTAYALFPQYLPDSLEIFLGLSDEIERWSEF